MKIAQHYARAGLIFGLTLALIFGLAAKPFAQNLPNQNLPNQNLPNTLTQLPGVSLFGQANLRFIIQIYDVGLYTSTGFDASKPYARPLALVVSPARGFQAQTVLRQLSKELARQPSITEAQLNKYTQQFAAVLPALEENQPLTGIYTPNQGWALHYKGLQIGQWSDDTFAKAFFDIWLGAHTSQAPVRQALLRLNN